jgi:RimJ/RimL family protein N-acetyltransferase
MSAPIIVPEGVLKEDGVELRPISEDDVPAFVEAFGDPAIAMGAYHGQLAGTDEALRPYLKRNSERMEAGEAVLLGVWEAGAPSLSGQTMLFRFDWDDLSAELGFWLAPPARGRGLTAPALRLTLALAFDRLGLERVYAFTDADNIGAQRAMERVGLTKEGVHRGQMKMGDRRLDQVSFGTLAGDRPGTGHGL